MASRQSGKSGSANAARGKTPARERGYFITLEGGEGSGKSTQMRLLAEYLEGQGHKVVTTREPGGSAGAEAVRHVLLSGSAEPFGAEMEAILFSAARGDHVDTVIAPALARGEFVISDRFFDSTRVYQGVSGKVSDTLVRHLERIACNGTLPDLTIIIDVDPEEGMQRAGKRRKADEAPDRFEKESHELQKLRREAYLEIAREEPERCVVVNGSGTPEQVFARIRREVEKRLGVGRNTGKGSAGSDVSANVKAGKPAPRKVKTVAHRKLTARRSKDVVATQTESGKS